MNINALRRTQLSIADETRPFHMECWPTCIAGHACRARAEELGCGAMPHVRDIPDIAISYLDIDSVTAQYLFAARSSWSLSDGRWVLLDKISRGDAIDVIDRVIATGALPPPPPPPPEPAPQPTAMSQLVAA